MYILAHSESSWSTSLKIIFLFHRKMHRPLYSMRAVLDGHLFNFPASTNNNISHSTRSPRGMKMTNKRLGKLSFLHSPTLWISRGNGKQLWSLHIFEKIPLPFTYLAVLFPIDSKVRTSHFSTIWTQKKVQKVWYFHEKRVWGPQHVSHLHIFCKNYELFIKWRMKIYTLSIHVNKSSF